jgi:hypothetical protein
MRLGFGWFLFSDSLIASCTMPPRSMWNSVPSMIALSIATWRSFVSGSIRLLLNSPMDANSPLLSVPLPLAPFFIPKSTGEQDGLVRCSRPHQLEKRSVSPRLCNLLQVPVPAEQEAFQVACEDQRLSQLPKDAQWSTERKQINHEGPR